MKKFLVGCLLVSVLLCVGAVAAWWFVLRPMWNAGVDGAKDWISAVDLGDDIRNQTPFEPPADGRMTAAQVDAFVSVQKLIAARMGPDLARMAGQAQAAAAERAAGTREPRLQDITTVFGETSAVLRRLRAAQAEGVNAVGLSREEYAWVRRQSLAALSQLVPTPQATDFAVIAGLPAVPGLTAPDADDAAAQAAARHNAALFRPHLPALREVAAQLEGLQGLQTLP